MTPEYKKTWFNKEDNLITYQHQHRGLRFLKLLLPPTTDRKVNLVGLDDHIYRGTIPKVPEDKLPPDVDEKSIDEESLYKEIRDMNFPPVPPQEPLGPSRRIGGQYTLAKKLSLAPVKVDCRDGREEIQILGKDGGIYKGTARYPSKVELDRQLRGTKRSIQKVRQQSSARGFVEPSLILLQTDVQTTPFGRRHRSSVELPAANVGKIIELVLSQNKRARKKDSTRAKDTEVRGDEAQPQQSGEMDGTYPGETEDADEPKDVENKEPLKDEESEDTEEKEESEDTEGKDESEDTEEKEESEDTEEKEDSADAEEKEESEDAEEKEESEDEEDKEMFEDTEEE